MFALIVPLSAIGGGMYPDNSLPGGQGGHPWFPGHGGGGYPSGQPVPGQGHPHPAPPIYLHPGQGWPPNVNPPIVPPDPPPGIYPPLPPGEPTTKALAVLYVSGYGTRYAVVEVPQPK